MLVAELQQCPRCRGTVDVEHFAVALFEDRRDEFLFCEFCAYGIERSVYDSGEVCTLTFRERSEPRAFGKFLQRLEDARAA